MSTLESSTATESAPARRKACDLCFTKKIKCDMLKPVCSNCILYRSECRTTSAARRKAHGARPKASVRLQLESQEEENEGLRARLARIEKQLQDVLEATKSQHVQAQELSDSPEGGSNSHASTDSRGAEWKFDPVQPSLYHGPTDEGLCLPPLDNIMPVVDHYFRVFNPVLPIFDQKEFMLLLTGWYNHTIKRDRVIWAAILMVCAMGLRAPVPGDRLMADTNEKMGWSTFCMRNAQSIMADLMAREEDLLGVQVLIALVLQFHNSSDSRPASVLVGTAVRLGHRMQLHSRSSTQNFSPDEVLQRNRVFWIAYLLDKDISLRTKAPAAQSDLDIDIPLPPFKPADGLGVIWTQDGSTQFSLFRIRIELSQILGRVYELLYSNRSMRISEAERRRRVEGLSTMLAQWYRRIPIPFRPEHVAAAVGDSELIQVVKLYHAYLLALVHVHGIYSNQAEWVSRVSSLSREAIRNYATSVKGTSPPCETEAREHPVAEGWNHCVEVSRGCIKLFQEAIPTECLLWQCSGPHFSGLIILLANMLMSPTHPYVTLDQKIAVKSMKLLDDFMEVVKTSGYEQTRRMIAELHKCANAAVDTCSECVDGAGVTGTDEATAAEADDRFHTGIREITGEEDADGAVWSMGVAFDPFVMNDGGASTWADERLWIHPSASST